MRKRNLLPFVLFSVFIFQLTTAVCGQDSNPSLGQSRNTQQTARPRESSISSARIQGRVLRAADERPLPKASITLSPEARPNEGVTVRADSGGVFEFSEVVPGRYRMTAERNGYVRRLYGQRGSGPGVVVNVNPGQRLDRIEFRLERAGVVSGVVTDEDNEPVEGVTVRALRLRFFPGGSQRAVAVRTSRTDDLGSFRLTGLARGLYYVQAGSREGISIAGPTTAYAYSSVFYPGVSSREEAQAVQVTPGAETWRVDIPVKATPTYTISGVIIDVKSGASPKSYSVGVGSGGAMAYAAVDRSDGTFSIPGLEPGNYNLVGQVFDEAVGPRRGFRRVTIVDSDVKVVIEIGRTVDVRGEIKTEGSSDSLFAGLYVALQPEDESAPPASSGVDEHGKFIIRNVPEGRYRIQISGRTQETYLKQALCGPNDYTLMPIAISVNESPDACTLLLANDVSQVTGMVTKDDRPVEGAIVILIPSDIQLRRIARNTASGQTSADGSFHIRGVVPGDYVGFAVMPADDAAYYDIEFADRNREAASHLSLKPDQSYSIKLKILEYR